MRRVAALLVTLVLAAVVASFAIGRARGWWFPKPASTFAPRVDALFEMVLWIAGVAIVAVLLVLAWVVATSNRERAPRGAGTHGDLRLELAWTLVPAAILIWIAAAQLDEWAELKHAARRPPVPTLARVIASQFDWHFVYPGRDGQFGTPDDLDAPFELDAPIGEPVVLELVSRDVIHSFFVPALRLKQDVVPGMRPEIWFEAREETVLDVECAELCGFGHYAMAGRLRLVSRAEFARRIAELERAQRDNGAAEKDAR